MIRKSLKEEKAITLVALIITIIVLLILAIVSIRLVMNGGIIDRAEKGTKAYTEAEIGEQLKLVYAEYQMGQYQTPVDIEARLKEIFGNDNVQDVSVANGKLTATIGSKVYQYNVNTGKSGEYVDAINYGTKTKETVAPGDDITIGTEKFKVFSVENGEIKAMPYYNLVLSANPIKQATAATADSAGISVFSTEAYWEFSVDAIDMSDSRNNIQQYIALYKTTLNGLGAESIEVRAAKYFEIADIDENYRNPGKIGFFWIGSSNLNNTKYVYCVTNNGKFTDIDNRSFYGGTFGVRPIIIIH